MIALSVDTTDLLKWARYLDELPEKSKPHVANALNVFGGGVARSTASYIAEQTDLAPTVVFDLLKIEEATPDNWVWKMDASALAPPSLDWSRPWETRDTKAFEQATLIKLVTQGDDRVCPICSDAAAHNPYTMEELIALRVKGYDGGNGLLHYGCRCLIGSWQMTRRLPVTWGRPGTAPPELFNVRQLGEAVARAMTVTVQANAA